MAIEDKILKVERIDWRQLKPLQPDDIKHVFNYQAIENSILEHGFVMPFAVWQDKQGDIYTVDGHTRFEVLSNMEDVPETLPALFIKADNREDAIRILLDVYNQKQNPIDQQVLMKWLDVEEIQVTRVEVRSLNLKYEGAGTAAQDELDNTGDYFSLDDDGSDNSERGDNSTAPTASHNDYSVFELVMLHENKLQLIDTINQVKRGYLFDKQEDALMEILRQFNNIK